MFRSNQSKKIRLLLAELPANERDRIWEKVHPLGRQAWVQALWAGLGALLVSFVPTIAYGQPGYPFRGIVYGLGAGAGACLGGTISAFAAVRRLRHELAVMGRCPNCGCDLGKTPDRCAKCGAIPLPRPSDKTHNG